MDGEELYHIGTPRHSGRYPWGSGKTPSQRNKSFINYVDDLKRKGLTEKERADSCGISMKQLRAKLHIAKMQEKTAQQALALKLSNSGMNHVEIGKQMGMGESSVRGLLDPILQARTSATVVTANLLKQAVKDREYIDIGVNSELYLGVTRNHLMNAVALLEEEEGYTTHFTNVPQLGTGGSGKKTSLLVLAGPGVDHATVFKNKDKIKMVTEYHSEDGGRSYFGMEPPKSLSSKRIKILYSEEGGSDKDGVIELRRGVNDISLGNSRYAQVRIAVDGTHYLKGMAMYNDNMPDGVDVIFNTNKKLGTPADKVFKPLKKDPLNPTKVDPDNPFGAVLKVINGQRHYKDANGKDQLSTINIVNEEGDWEKWNKSLSSQMLSKQTQALAKKQLGITYSNKQEAFDEIMALTNPAIKKKLLDSFAGDCDSAAVHLKAAGLPRQGSHVILPIPSMKDTEVYAPNYLPGEPVVLIRYPHGGTFEIPNLVVNNKQPAARKLLDTAKDAIGISPNVAKRMSGADFDGDSVLVIPNKNGNTIKTSAALKGLQDFDPQESYRGHEGLPDMKAKTKGVEMGKISNLITDMSIGGADVEEICRAVKHSMVVIDAEKHHLDYKQSYVDQGIGALKKKYQSYEGSTTKSGASTLLSRASSEIRVDPRKLKTNIKKMTAQEVEDYKAGKKVWEYSPEVYIPKKKITDTNKMTEEQLADYKLGKTIYDYPRKKDGTPIMKEIPRTISSTKLAETSDAFTLSSGTRMEAVYATHSNKLKALANSARKESIMTKPIIYSPSANIAYAPQVATLLAQLKIAGKNAPLERQAQILANSLVKARKAANPDLDPVDLKKIVGQTITEARTRIGANKYNINITDKEWEAIQAGALSNNRVIQILNNTNVDLVKKLATPRTKSGMAPAKEARARAMLASGNTQAEIANALGVSVSTINALQ